MTARPWVRRAAGWLVVALLCASAAAPSPADARSVAATCPSPAPPEQVILTIGDSITEGATMTGSVSPSYRAELGRLLDDACVPHFFAVAAVGGTTCGYWSSRMAGLMTTYRPDIVLINCGTNDRMDTKTPSQITAWEGMYRSLFDTVLDSDPDVYAYPAFVQYSAGSVATGCTAHGPIPWLPVSEAIGNDARYRAMRVIDEWGSRVPEFVDYQPIPEGYLDECGVHPTPGGYDVMGRIAFNRLAQHLGVPPVPLPCGLVGRRPGGVVPNWIPCQQMVVVNQ